MIKDQSKDYLVRIIRLIIRNIVIIIINYKQIRSILLKDELEDILFVI